MGQMWQESDFSREAINLSFYVKSPEQVKLGFIAGPQPPGPSYF